MKYLIRKLSVSDLKNDSFFETLSNLKKIDGLSSQKAKIIFRDCQKRGIDIYVVVERKRIISTLRLMFESKFYHQGQMAAHIEDVATHKDHVGQGAASALIKHVINICQKKKCYKIILNCHSSYLSFYNKFGFKKSAECLRLNIKTGA